MAPPTKRARLDKDTTESEPAPQLHNISSLEEYRLTDMPDADVYYVSDFISDETATEWYQGLLALDTWYQPVLKVYGKEVVQSRKIAAYATSPTLTLKYSGHPVDMRYEYPPLLRAIQDAVEARLGVVFNHIILNLYEDGGVYIGSHRDSPDNRVIASVSLGAPRTFVMTHDALKAPASRKAAGTRATRSARATRGAAPPVPGKRWLLANGSLLVMQGETQRHWKHAIPRERAVKEGRISLTFRQLVT